MARSMGSAVLLGQLLILTCLHSSVLGMYSSSSPVASLGTSDFKSKVKASGMALVEFYAPWCGHCQSLKPEYEKAAKALKGAVMVAAVDADQHKELAQEYGIRGFPTIKFVYMDGDKVKSSDYQGQRTAKDMVGFAMDKAKALALKRLGEKAGGGSSSGSNGNTGSKGSKGGAAGGAGADSGFYTNTDVVTLTDDNFGDLVTGSSELWMVEFYAPWCGHCKNLKPEWISAASQLKGKVSVGAVDCTAHQSVCDQYSVRGYPTIKFFGSSKSSPEDYNGARDAAAIAEFATQKWAKQAPPPELVELTGPEVWRSACTAGGAGGSGHSLCFLAFLPDILDSKASGRNRYLSMLQQAADKYKDRPYGWLWAQGGAQQALETSVGVGGFGYPALVAYRPKDGLYSVLKASFEAGHITQWVDDVRQGKQSVVVGPKGSEMSIASTSPWDGKDAAVQLEDEFSLDDLNEL